MSNKVPDVKKCPRCGNPIFVDETECSQCGYSVASLEDRLRNFPATPIAVAMISSGVFIMFLAFGEEINLTLFVMFLLGGGLIVGGGLVYAWFMLYNNPLRKRK